MFATFLKEMQYSQYFYGAGRKYKKQTMFATYQSPTSEISV